MAIDPLASSGSKTGASNSTKSLAKLGEDFDTFLKLLTTQLQNQDPTQPLDTNEFTNQIALFAQVQQTVDTNQKISDLLELQKQQNNGAEYIGKVVESKGNATELRNGQAAMTFDLAGPAEKATILIRNSSGELVRKLEVNDVAGRQTVAWDGLDEFDNVEPDGTYTFTVGASNGKESVATTTFTRGTVSGVKQVDGEPVLMVGNVPVKLDDVITLNSDSNTQAALAQSVQQLGQALQSGNFALGYIGKTVDVISNQFAIKDHNQPQLNYEVVGKAKKLTVVVKHADGYEVYRKVINDPAEGEQVFTWTGQNTAGSYMPDGVYNVEFVATDADNKKLPAVSYISGRVEGLDYTQGAPLLVVNDLIIPANAVARVREPEPA